jgi:hypothetical protein
VPGWAGHERVAPLRFESRGKSFATTASGSKWWLVPDER